MSSFEHGPPEESLSSNQDLITWEQTSEPNACSGPPFGRASASNDVQDPFSFPVSVVISMKRIERTKQELQSQQLGEYGMTSELSFGNLTPAEVNDVSDAFGGKRILFSFTLKYCMQHGVYQNLYGPGACGYQVTRSSWILFCLFSNILYTFELFVSPCDL